MGNKNLTYKELRKYVLATLRQRKVGWPRSNQPSKPKTSERVAERNGGLDLVAWKEYYKWYALHYRDIVNLAQTMNREATGGGGDGMNPPPRD